MSARDQGPAAYALAFLGRWYVLGVAGLGAVAVVLGVFEGDHPLSWLRVVTGAGVGALVFDDARARLRGRSVSRPYYEQEGPLLWVVGTWMVVRLGGAYAGDLTALSAAVVAWLVAFNPSRVSALACAVAVTLEVGLGGAGHQDGVALVIHLAVYALAAAALRKLPQVEGFRRRLAEQHASDRQKQHNETRAKDLRLKTEQLDIVKLPGADSLGNETVGRVALSHLDASFQLQLDLLRDAFELTTAAVLWRTADDEADLRLHSWSSDRELLPGPYDAAKGLPASVLRDGTEEVAVAPVHRGFAGLPYYADSAGVGAVLVLAIPGRDSQPAGVLCVDRESEAPWTESQRSGFRRAARKLGLDVESGQRLKAVDHERSTVRRWSAALQRLNGAQDIESVATVATATVSALVEADLVVLSLLQDSEPGVARLPGDLVHTVIAAAGDHAERYEGLNFTGDEGLVGQAVKFEHALPEVPYKPKQTVFTPSSDKVLSDMRDLRIVPLLREEGPPIGALTVLSRREGAFASPRREMLDLVAQQVATKLDLAQAYERIRQMAMVDELTKLKNRRTFEQAFETMLSRAKRQRGPLSIIITDIDRFKRFNDTYGHPFGDLVLQRVAAVLQQAVRQVDLAARWGGEEFTILLEDASEEGALQLAERIRQDVQALTFEHETGPVRLTLSLGTATYPDDARTPADLLSRADEALFYAKEHGRNQAVAASTLRPVDPPMVAAHDPQPAEESKT